MTSSRSDQYGTRHHHDHAHFAPSPGAKAAFGVAVAWTLAWKAASLWRAAKNDSKPWFGVLLLSNTLGVLDAIYLFGVDGARRRAARAEKAVSSGHDDTDILGLFDET